jgi:methylase of polypeptide subunit release factors
MNANTPIFKEGSRLFADAVNHPHASTRTLLKTFLRDNHYSDPLLLATSSSVGLWHTSDSRPSDFEEWVMTINLWKDRFFEPGDKHPADAALHILWESFENSLHDKLREGIKKGIPRRGGILAFVAGVSKCIVMDYEFDDNTPQIKPIATIDSPKSLFDFWATIDTVTKPAAQNALKDILVSGHKIVYQRGALVHVDRRRDLGVFGPTIDTVLLAEALVQYVLESNTIVIRNAVEVGSGNGLVSAVLLENSKSINNYVALDVDFTSVSCTARNCSYNGFPQNHIHYINGLFDPQLFGRKFDLCICNPPYIPLPPTSYTQDARFDDNRRATGGTELLETLIKSIPMLLTSTGAILLITSHLALSVIHDLMPKGYNAVNLLGGQGWRVGFDVDAVVTDRVWLDYLIQSCGLISEEGSFYHTLHPLLISKERVLF